MQISLKLLSGALLTLTALSSTAAPIDINGKIDGDSEYLWNTTQDVAPQNTAWETRDYGSATDGEINDGSGGKDWNINYLGVDVQGDQFHLGVEGGSILSGSNFYRGSGLELSAFAINVVTGDGDETFDYALQAQWTQGDNDSKGDPTYTVDTNPSTGELLFSLFALTDDSGAIVGEWQGRGRAYNNQPYSYGSTDLFRMEGVGGTVLAPIKENIGFTYKPNDEDEIEDNHVLEGSFDLGLLSLFKPEIGGKVITHLTMSCVNDVAIVGAHIAAVPLPSSVWLFGTALLGFIGFSRRTRI